MTVQQEFYLKTVRTFGCLREGQLLTLMRRRFHTPGVEDVNEGHMAAILRQLRHGNWDICQSDGLVCLARALPDPYLLEAIDIMLELSGGLPAEFRSGELPVLLRFSIQGEKLRLFTVAKLSSIDIPLVSMERRKKERIIWISESGAAPEGLVLPHKHFFAARQPDGSHRFYGSMGP